MKTRIALLPEVLPALLGVTNPTTEPVQILCVILSSSSAKSDTVAQVPRARRSSCWTLLQSCRSIHTVCAQIFFRPQRYTNWSGHLCSGGQSRCLCIMTTKSSFRAYNIPTEAAPCQLLYPDVFFRQLPSHAKNLTCSISERVSERSNTILVRRLSFFLQHS